MPLLISKDWDEVQFLKPQDCLLFIILSSQENIVLIPVATSQRKICSHVAIFQEIEDVQIRKI